MKEIKIAHLSDLHVLQDYTGSMFEEIKMPIYPDSYFQQGLRQAVSQKPDVIILAGDLVHEADAKDYAYLKKVVDKYVGDIPVLPVLGNHDIKSEFYKGFLKEDKEGSLYYEKIIEGFRFLIIDTSVEFQGDGIVREEQVQWLEKRLKTPSEHGTILVGHHPLESRQAWFKTTYGKDFKDVVVNSDIFGYLCGHSHYFETRMWNGITQVTADSFAFGVESSGEHGQIYFEARGFNTLWAKNKEIVVHVNQVHGNRREFLRFEKIGSEFKVEYI